MSNLVQLAYETDHAWLALGHESIVGPHAQFVRELQHPDVYDANFACRVRAETPDEIDATLAELDRAFSHCTHRRVLWDPATPQPLAARLALDGWERFNDLITLVLEGPLRTRGSVLDIRPVASDSDWLALEALCRLDHEEEAAQGFHAAWDRGVTQAMVRTKRQKAPHVQYFIARVDSHDCGFFSAWPGVHGVGQIEDLFTAAEFRGRGVASSLIVACVNHARARGAGSIIINARVEDTPKQLYAGLGFRPLCLQHSYLKHVPAGAQP